MLKKMKVDSCEFKLESLELEMKLQHDFEGAILRACVEWVI